MRFTTAHVLPLVASALVGAAAHADDHAQFAQGGNATSAVHHDPHPPQVIIQYPQGDWTSAIGTGTAAALEERRNSSKQIQNNNDDPPPARFARYPEPDWTSRIGTSTAAMFEH